MTHTCEQCEERLRVAVEALEKVKKAIIETATDTVWVSNGCTAVEEIDYTLAKIKEGEGKRGCGLCLPGKPCNMEGCLNDTVPATDYNALNAKLAVAREALDSIATWEKWCGSSKCTCRQDMAKVALAALSPVTKDEGEK